MTLVEVPTWNIYSSVCVCVCVSGDAAIINPKQSRWSACDQKPAGLLQPTINAWLQISAKYLLILFRTMIGSLTQLLLLMDS